MPLPDLLTRPCACGAARDTHGRCLHCDLPTFHPKDTVCENCKRIARRCVACRAVHPDAQSAATCERNDRAQEIRRRA